LPTPDPAEPEVSSNALSQLQDDIVQQVMQNSAHNSKDIQSQVAEELANIDLSELQDLNLIQLTDDLSEMPDDDILAFSSEISETEEVAPKPEPAPAPQPK
jgi:hypothetical protein